MPSYKRCENCRWKQKRAINYYPCSECVLLHDGADYNFFCLPEQLNMFGFAELVRCRSCGKHVRMEFGSRGYKYIRCHCGCSLQAKVSVEEMIKRWNNKPPCRTKMWRVQK